VRGKNNASRSGRITNRAPREYSRLAMEGNRMSPTPVVCCLKLSNAHEEACCLVRFAALVTEAADVEAGVVERVRFW